MFCNPHRPVPSKAALRVLRQLAYISSGTACGAAALVVEERRRQIRVAKKVVENSKRLKQHPRYAHSSTATVLPQNDSITDNGETSFREQTQDLTTAREGGAVASQSDATASAKHTTIQSEPEYQRVESEAFRDNTLPSEVDKAYRKFSKRQRNARSARPLTDAHEDNNAGYQGSTYRDRRSYSQLAMLTNTSNIEANLSTPDIDSKQSIMIQLLSGHHGETLHEPSSRLKTPSTNPPSRARTSRAHSVSNNDSVKSLKSRSAALNSARIKRSVSAFLALYPHSTLSDSSKSNTDMVALAASLLEQAAQAGLLQSLQRMTVWMLRRDVLSSDLLHSVCLNSYCVFAQNDHLPAFNFYTQLLLNPKVQQLTPGLDQCKLLVTASMLEVDPKLFSDPGRLDFARTVKKNNHASKMVIECCEALLKAERPNAAMLLLQHCAFSTRIVRKDARLAMVCEIYQTFLDANDLVGCTKLLRWMDENSPDLQPRLRSLAVLCSDSQANVALVNLCKYIRTRPQQHLPDEVYPALYSALAFFGHRETAKQFIQSSRRPTDDALMRDCQPAWAALLERFWNDTKNLMTVDNLFQSMHQLAGKTGTGPALYNAMICVSVRAGKVSKAEEYLRRMQDNGIQPNLTTFAYFIHAAARSQEWQKVESLLGLLDAAVLANATSSERATLFDPLLSEYVRHHEPSEVWAFVARAIDIYRLGMSRTTSQIVLESFVHGGRIDLIPQWTAYMATHGIRLAMGAQAAVAMLRRYYYDMRPSHVVMMWLGRNLTRQAPDLRSEGLDLLLREAIAYDIRESGTGANSRRLSERAQARLKLLGVGEGVLSGPNAIRRDNMCESAAKAAENATEDNDRLYTEAELKEGLEEETSVHEDFQEAIGEDLEDVDSGYASDTASGLPTASDSLGRRRRETEILLALSLGNPADAVSLYKQSLSIDRLPLSSLSLESAITASIRSHEGDTTEAEELFGSAQDAGMNVSAALLPLLLQRIKNLSKEGRSQALEELQTTVSEFYRIMEENNIPVRHHVVTAAAQALMKHGKANAAVSLLRNVYDSSAASPAGKSFDLPAMTTLFQGYAKSEQLDGMEWTVNTILDENYRINNAFLRTLKHAKSHFKLAASVTSNESYARIASRVDQLRDACKKRQREQIRATTSFGNRLVRCLCKEHGKSRDRQTKTL
ncbi:hypothetical protein AAFC00_004096 [Neodothiora populina]|uniref:Pentatricopeptide repeat protein n=1 Tax=Neodothiora populina TaxID=2781224 RepID=A0ABR3PII4_9PEZI